MPYEQPGELKKKKIDLKTAIAFQDREVWVFWRFLMSEVWEKAVGDGKT